MSEKNLFDAIECGDVELLKSLLAAGGDVNATHTDTSDSDRMADYAAMTQEDFSRAMGASDKDIARLNEAMDAQLGEKRNLFEEQFKAMMNMATQFTRASESPKTVLMAAAAKGRADMLALLLDAGADVNAAVPSGYDKGETALMLAAASGSAEAVQVLLARGAKADAALTDYP